jgi:hypothetical protein
MLSSFVEKWLSLLITLIHCLSGLERTILRKLDQVAEFFLSIA